MQQSGLHNDNLFVPVDSFWFGTDSTSDGPDGIDDHDAVIDAILDIESVDEVEKYAEIRVQTNCELHELNDVMRKVHEVLEKHGYLTPLGKLKLKYHAKVSQLKSSGLATLNVTTEQEYDWLEMLEDVRKIDPRYQLGKANGNCQCFCIRD